MVEWQNIFKQKKIDSSIKRSVNPFLEATKLLVKTLFIKKKKHLLVSGFGQQFSA